MANVFACVMRERQKNGRLANTERMHRNTIYLSRIRMKL